MINHSLIQIIKIKIYKSNHSPSFRPRNRNLNFRIFLIQIYNFNKNLDRYPLVKNMYITQTKVQHLKLNQANEKSSINKHIILNII